VITADEKSIITNLDMAFNVTISAID